MELRIEKGRVDLVVAWSQDNHAQVGPFELTLTPVGSKHSWWCARVYLNDEQIDVATKLSHEGAKAWAEVRVRQLVQPIIEATRELCATKVRDCLTKEQNDRNLFAKQSVYMDIYDHSVETLTVLLAQLQGDGPGTAT